MKNMKKFAMFLCAVMLLLGMAGCSGAGTVSVPKGHTPTISENINTLRNSGYRIQRQHYCSVKSILVSGTTHRVADYPGETVSIGNVAKITLQCASHGDSVMTEPNILYPGGSVITVGQSCCIVTCTDQLGAYSATFLVFGG